MRRRPVIRRPGRSWRTEAAPRTLVLRGAVLVALLAVIGTVGLRSPGGVPLVDYRTYHVEMPDVGDLHTHDAIRIAGVRVGQVLDPRLTTTGRARVKLQLDPGVQSLPRDTFARIRAAGLVGARYLELVPGRSDSRLADGATIRMNHDIVTSGVPETLATFDTETRGALGTMISELGAGLLGNGDDLNEGVRVASEAQAPARDLFREVLARPGAARRLLPSLDRAVTALAPASSDLADSFAAGGRALQPFVDERDAFGDMLDQAPPALRTARAGLTEGVRLLSAARSLATATAETLPNAPEALQATSALLRESPAALRRATSLLEEVRQAVPAALGVTRSLSPTLGPLREMFETAAPMLTELTKYGCDIENTGAVLRSMTGFGFPTEISTGPDGAAPLRPVMQFRLQATLSPEENAGHRGSSSLNTSDPYPEPCKYSTGRPVSEVELGGAR